MSCCDYRRWSFFPPFESVREPPFTARLVVENVVAVVIVAEATELLTEDVILATARAFGIAVEVDPLAAFAATARRNTIRVAVDLDSVIEHLAVRDCGFALGEVFADQRCRLEEIAVRVYLEAVVGVLVARLNDYAVADIFDFGGGGLVVGVHFYLFLILSYYKYSAYLLCLQTFIARMRFTKFHRGG